jgi:hypothetical protein
MEVEINICLHFQVFVWIPPPHPETDLELAGH